MSTPDAPGKDQIRYRAGTHAAFRASMLDALGDEAALSGLRTRDADDAVVALCDAWATTLDVMAFLTERTANEGFLRTATERRSLVELARAIGYELRPGVAADTHLAFSVVATPGAPASFPIPAGTRAQSVPGPGELPQSFETVEPITAARPEWNAQPVRAAAPRDPKKGDEALRLAGTALGLVAGDTLLIVTSSWFDLRRVEEIEVVPAVVASDTDQREVIAGHTVVTLDAAIDERTGTFTGVSGAEVHHLRQRAAIFGYNAPAWGELPVAMRIGELHPGLVKTALLALDAPDLSQLGSSPIAGAKAPAGKTPPSKAAGKQATVDKVATKTGADAPVSTVAAGHLLTAEQGFIAGQYAGLESKWADAAISTGTTQVHLDQAYPNIIVGSWTALERAESVVARRVSAVAEVPHRAFGMSARVTRLTLHADVGGFGPRTTTVHAASRRLELAPAPLPTMIGGGSSTDAVELAFPFSATETPISAGRTVVLSGLDATGKPAGEVAVVRSVLGASGAGPLLRLTKKLTGAYRRTSLRVMANAARATHGESRAEILGSGDQRVPFQSFTARHSPLTHTRATTASGTATTLAVWVQGVRWQEVPSLHGRGPTDRVYVTRRADDGTIRITFGDGRTGSRLPTGRDNVVATMRTGIGRAANLGIARITIPLSRPLGLKDVTNPVAATGAADPEELSDARTNAPLPVRTIGRVVSLTDYADFARAYAGVDKARADVVWDGERNVIVVTVAGSDGAAIDSTGPLATSLTTAIDEARHATVAIEVAGYVPLQVALKARLVTAADRRFEDVAKAAKAMLVDQFSFRRTEFARPIPESEVVRVLHSVPGVVGVLVDEFHEASAPASRDIVVDARPARRVGATTHAAQLLTVAADGSGIELTKEVAT